jgi:hypothetical protein
MNANMGARAWLTHTRYQCARMLLSRVIGCETARRLLRGRLSVSETSVEDNPSNGGEHVQRRATAEAPLRLDWLDGLMPRRQLAVGRFCK